MCVCVRVRTSMQLEDNILLAVYNMLNVAVGLVANIASLVPRFF